MKTACVACGGTQRNSRGGVCMPCATNRIRDPAPPKMKKEEPKMEKQVLYLRKRPKTFKEVIGQDAAVSTLVGFGKRRQVPHCILISGGSGTGKTTLLRILREKLKCGDADFTEVNAATANGIDMVRDIQRRCHLSPISGPCRVWVIDECHQLTTQAQNAFLKILEDTPAHVYFFLATTDPQKLIKTVRSRATEIKLAQVPNTTIARHVVAIAAEEGWCMSQDVADAIAEASEGGVRKAMVILDQISSLTDEADQLAAVAAADIKKQAFELARALMAPRITWATVGGILANLEDDPESLRYMVLGYANSVLVKKADGRAAMVIDAFRDNFYDSKKAGLTYACFQVYQEATGK